MPEQKNDCEDVDHDEDSDSSVEWEKNNMFAFARSILDNDPETNRGMSEIEKRSLDPAAARSECERFSSN